MINRVIILLLDGVGVGELPDAKIYNDEGSDTLGNLSKVSGGLNLPNFKELGLGNIHPIIGVESVNSPLASYGKMKEVSAGKDTTSGHWEIAGLKTLSPFPVYLEGFPPEVIKSFESAIGCKTLGNIPCSGTEILKQLGPEHIKTSFPIVYTSADSVFQIAAHEEVIPVEKLYEMCHIARKLLQDKYNVCRVIARPFIGKFPKFIRTDRRKDFSVPPPEKTVLDYAKEQGYKVYGVGKIEDIFAGHGLTDSIHITDNADGLNQTLKVIRKKNKGIIFTNLVDFDTLYGHRNNAEGFVKALEEVDMFLPKLLKALSSDDMFIITADHGCDPTTASTDHSREYIPLLVYGQKVASGINLGVRETFSDIAATIKEVLNLKGELEGKSFAQELNITVEKEYDK